MLSVAVSDVVYTESRIFYYYVEWRCAKCNWVECSSTVSIICFHFYKNFALGKYARVLVPGKLLQPSLIFAGKANSPALERGKAMCYER